MDLTISLVITTAIWGTVNLLGVERTLRIIVEILKQMNDS